MALNYIKSTGKKKSAYLAANPLLTTTGPNAIQIVILPRSPVVHACLIGSAAAPACYCPKSAAVRLAAVTPRIVTVFPVPKLTTALPATVVVAA